MSQLYSAMETCVDEQMLARIRAEYLEMPDMRLRVEQVRRLCGLERSLCQLALDVLVEAKFLRLRSDGTYVRFVEGSSTLASGRLLGPGQKAIEIAGECVLRNCHAALAQPRRESIIAGIAAGNPQSAESHHCPLCCRRIAI
jgi:hypothetical protein